MNFVEIEDQETIDHILNQYDEKTPLGSKYPNKYPCYMVYVSHYGFLFDEIEYMFVYDKSLISNKI